MAMAKNSIVMMVEIIEGLRLGILLDPIYLRLYTNTPTLGPSMVPADFDDPLDSGYPTGGVLTTSWGSAVEGVTCAHTDADTITFTFNHDLGDIDINGIWFHYLAGGAVLWAQAFDVPVSITVAGQPLSVIPRYEAGDLTVPCT